MSTAFGPASTSVSQKSADPIKHVNYVLGMVLGVDDFSQEFAYHSERDRWLVRELLGYGTAWGLTVGCKKAERQGRPDIQVVVSPGVAVSPLGQLIRVAPAQCASLQGWLDTKPQSDKVKEWLWKQTDEHARNPPPLSVYVVLGYRAYPTDKVPIPGEPCRSEDDVMEPSRITDGFQLELRLEPPEHPEEQGVGELMRWLRAHLEPDPLAAESDPAALPGFLDGLRARWGLKDATTPQPKLRIRPEELADFLRAAFRVWVTEIRPKWRPTRADEARSEDVVLLAELGLPFTREDPRSEWKLIPEPTQIRIDERQRPLLLHLRLLQEWLLQGAHAALGYPTPATPQPIPPPVRPVYEVVAAGIVKGVDEPGREDTYGDLRALWTDKGRIVFTFEDYQDPQFRQSGYVVKVLPVSCEVTKAHSVVFCGFMKQGFVVHVFDKDGNPTDEEIIKQLKYVIEVSAYPLGGKP